MKKFSIFLLIFFTLVLPVFAKNVMPSHVSKVYTDTLGIYQANNEITLYSEPSESSDVIIKISYKGDNISPAGKDFAKVFIVYLPQKDLALFAVTDETEDWVKVIYDNEKGLSGWLKKDDPYKFMSWISFYNIYGKKYGLYLLKDLPESIKDLHGSADDSSQVVSRLNVPQKIKLHVLRGNWAMVSVMDMDKTPKTGYIRWRSDNGVKYLFPDIK